MAETPDRTSEINALQSILNSGARSISTDGVTTTFESADAIRKRIAELQAEVAGTTSRILKPRIRGIDLRGAW